MDDVVCPLDLEFADQIAALLEPPSPQSIKDYYEDVVKARRYCGVEVKEGGEFGKGAYATKDFKEEELILQDHMLVAAQHNYNKIDCLVCSYCFCFIGSIELQIGRKLFLHSLNLSAEADDDNKTFSDTSDEGCPSELMDSEVHPTKCCDNMQSCSSGDVNLNNSHISEGVLASLMNGTLTLPYTKYFSLPPIISCLGGCEEEHYCSEQCAKADWEKFHSLLCTGEKSQSSKKEALIKFLKHANRTNDIFILAAKVISYTILKYKRLKNAYFEEKEESNGFYGKDKFPFSLILEAWKPTSMGFKKRWWDCIALPDDIDDSNEDSFRLQIKKLAFTSLQLLKEAIFDVECAPLFSLEIYGHIIGMFELNNLDLVVASPVEDYFVHIDDLPLPEKEETEKVTRPFLDALGDDYSKCCGGSAFFPIQSCMNHSCCPNAKAFKRDEDKDGETVILAVRPIREGEEITISYIEDGLPYKERQKQLADYGFKCRCSKCMDEQNHCF